MNAERVELDLMLALKRVEDEQAYQRRSYMHWMPVERVRWMLDAELRIAGCGYRFEASGIYAPGDVDHLAGYRAILADALRCGKV